MSCRRCGECDKYPTIHLLFANQCADFAAYEGNPCVGTKGFVIAFILFPEGNQNGTRTYR